MNGNLPPVAGAVYGISGNKPREWVRLYAARWEILFVRHGRLQLICDDSTLELAEDKNNFLIYKPGYTYRFRAFPGTEYISINFDLRADLAEQVSFPETFDGLGCFNLSAQLLRRVRRDLQEIMELKMCQSSNGGALALLLAETILMRVSTSTSGSGMRQPKLLKAFSLLSRMDDVPMKTVAKECGLSVPVLYKLFKHETGETPRNYHEKIKLKEAARQLRETTLTLGEIALAVDMCDQYYLSKRFKKMYNTSPSEYRKVNSQKK